MQLAAKSEKLDREIEQLELLIEELQAPSTAPPRAPADAAAEKDVPVRRPMAAQLPRESVVHAPLTACPSCGGTLCGPSAKTRLKCSTTCRRTGG